MKQFELLNKNQKKAVIAKTKRLLVLAGAGSGKTKTLLQKIIYLIEEESVKSSEILAVTFTRNAANEMIDRLILGADKSDRYQNILSNKTIDNQSKNVHRRNYTKNFAWIDKLSITTFHGFCYKLLKDYGVNEFDNRFKVISNQKLTDENSKITAPETSYEILHKLLIEKCSTNKSFLLDLKRYILDYFVDYIHTKKSYHYQYGTKYYSCLDGTMVRSKSEQFIADWLFRRSIKFIYEPEINIKDFPFRPDFYIPEADLYLEHVSNLSKNMHEKEKQFKKGNVLFVKTYESQTKDSAYFSHILDDIIKNRITDSDNEQKIISYIEAFKGYEVSVKDFINQTLRVNDMIKTENINPQTIYRRAAKDQHQRVRDFYKLTKPLLKLFNDYCINKSYLDFNDLITRSISLMKKNKDISSYFKKRFKYILVDEFQDVNNLQVELLKLMTSSTNQLFCVGDDWQSIYGFRGSNPDYILNFEKYFKKSRVIKLNLNYRSTHNIVEAGNKVIRHNKYMVDKDMTAIKKSAKKIVVYSGNDVHENVEYAAKEVKLLFDAGYSSDDILFLYRRSKMYYEYKNYFKRENIKVQAKTIHSAKGLEAKIVFIIGLSEGYGGFPDIWMKDRLFQVIKKANHDLLLEEERRLFYVAVTRARDELYLLAEKGNESSFINEIPKIYTQKINFQIQIPTEEDNLCPKCKHLIDTEFSYCPQCGEKIIFSLQKQ